MNLTCEICELLFEHKTWRRTCGTECKRKLQKRITLEQFADPVKRLRHQNATIEAMEKLDMKTIVNENRRSYKGENHPSFGVERSAEWRENISKGNIGKLKGRTWDDIMGVELATSRRAQNSDTMIETNERLLNERTSNLENTVANCLPEFQRNKKVGKWVVDLIDVDRKIIIEVNGDYWHGNPRVYQSDVFIPSIGMTAGEKNMLDNQRNDQLRQMGYNVIVLWELDIHDKTNDEIKVLVETALKNK